MAADGTIDLAKYGRIRVSGFAIEEAEQKIETAVSAELDKPVSINVRLLQSVQKYYVIGEVNSPGAYPLTGNETVLDGILAAGGLTTRASACDLLLARPTDPCSCRVTLPVCYRAITQLGDTTTNYQIKPGDRIFVGRQTYLEELFSCCGCQQGCSRCAKTQTACCDPLSGQNEGPSFGRDDFAMVESALNEPGIPLDDEVHVDVPAHQPQQENRPSALPPVSDPAPNPILDGELDFEAFPEGL